MTSNKSFALTEQSRQISKTNIEWKYMLDLDCLDKKAS